MKNKFLFLVAAATILLTSCSKDKGESSSYEAFKIYDEATLVEFAQMVDEKPTTSAILIANIELTDEWSPTSTFSGVFDGGGYTISNLTITNANGRVGLFSDASNATIKNLTIEGSVTNGRNSYVSLFAGSASSTTFSNCHISAKSSIYSEGSYVGSLVGYANDSYIINCSNKGSVEGDYKIGGLVGTSYNTAIVNCYNTGSVDGSEDVGGVLGYQYSSSSSIVNCYNAGSIVGSTDVGGVLGDKSVASSEVSKCYYDSDLYSGASIDAAYDVTPMPTANMQAATFTETLNAGADEYNATNPTIEAAQWVAVSGDYPTFE